VDSTSVDQDAGRAWGQNQVLRTAMTSGAGWQEARLIIKKVDL
jgi:hypothetical protein